MAAFTDVNNFPLDPNRIPTIQELAELYLLTAQSKYPDADISALSDYQAKAQAMAAIGARLAIDANTLFNAAYPQNGNSFGINTQLAARGAPSQYPAASAQLILSISGIDPALQYSIPIGTILTTTNNQSYSVLSPNNSEYPLTITSDSNTLAVISIATGSMTSQINGTILYWSPPQLPTDNSNNPLPNPIVTLGINGADEESLPHAINRLLEIQQVPLDGTRSTDFKEIAIEPSDGITDAILLINNELLYEDSPKTNVAIFGVSGSEVTDEFLNQGLIQGSSPTAVFERNITIEQINSIQTNLINQNLMGIFPISNSVSTQGLTTLAAPLTPYIKVLVTLQTGYMLSEIIQINDISLTIQELIQRETRRAICAQPYGAYLEYDVSNGVVISSSLPVSSIEQQLDQALGTPTTDGTYGTILASRSIYLYDLGSESYNYISKIPLLKGIPTTANSGNSSLQWIYDISLTAIDIYPNIGVELET